MAAAVIFEHRHFLLTAFGSIRASGVELASRRWVDRARNVSFQNHPLSCACNDRVRNRNRTHQSLGIRVNRVFVQLIRISELYHVAQIHYADTVRNVPYNRDIVSDEEVRQPQLSLQVFKHVYYLRLNRYVQSRNRLIADDKFRLYGQSSGDTDSLLLSAREFVRKTVGMFCIQSYFLEKLIDSGCSLSFSGTKLMDIQCLTYDFADSHTRVERCRRILEYNLHFAPVRKHFLSDFFI